MTPKTPPQDETARRKDSHLDLCAQGEVESPGNETLFGEVSLVHEALPEVDFAEVALGTEFLGRRLEAPVLVTGMSGGTERSGRLNRELACVAESLGVAFGVGSQRALLTEPAALATYRVREAAPAVVLLGNLGLWQARALGVDGVRRLMDDIGADGIAIHLNAAQELVQPEGDRDFREGLATLQRLAQALGPRLVVKETGCGMSPATARRLVQAGVLTLDVAGLGGTSWVRVETLRAEGDAAAVGRAFSGWGIPTAASVASVAAACPSATLVASGGLRDGLDAARALALGAKVAGYALPVFRAFEAGGAASATAFLRQVVQGLRTAMVLTGSADLAALRVRPRVLGPRLQAWLAALG